MILDSVLILPYPLFHFSSTFTSSFVDALLEEDLILADYLS
ncbi:MAG TPA: hypothetical protein VJ583_02985 [Nitrososphaeraceae archaeon]|nr:hypothetical protein [Nitrososphaeraceae archaeon]